MQLRYGRNLRPQPSPGLLAMIVYCTQHWLERSCKASDIPWEQCRECIVGEDGERLKVDPHHAHYPQRRHVATARAANGGPGTELKKLLKRFGISPSPGCPCQSRAQEMDLYGCDWCEQNTAEIIGWLREEATKRKLPFADFVGRSLVKLAIARARKGTGNERR